MQTIPPHSSEILVFIIYYYANDSMFKYVALHY